ncbi:MAG TPA: hypothetical protein VM012_14115 [Flavitalea sp.]|nr:hypothetical protein [Flavitalea sp.]
MRLCFLCAFARPGGRETKKCLVDLRRQGFVTLAGLSAMILVTLALLKAFSRYRAPAFFISSHLQASLRAQNEKSLVNLRRQGFVTLSGFKPETF